MCAQTRPWFILSSERGLFGGMESEPMLTPREKSPLREKFSSKGGSYPRRCIKQDSEPNTLPTELFRPLQHFQLHDFLRRDMWPKRTSLRDKLYSDLEEPWRTADFVWRQASLSSNRLVGLVVKVSASRVEDPGFESRLSRDFFGVESYQ